MLATMPRAAMNTSLGAGFSPDSQRTSSSGEQFRAAARRSSLPIVAIARRSVRVVAVSFPIVFHLTRERIARLQKRKEIATDDVQLCTRGPRRLERHGQEARQIAHRRYPLPLHEQRGRGESDTAESGAARAHGGVFQSCNAR